MSGNQWNPNNNNGQSYGYNANNQQQQQQQQPFGGMFPGLLFSMMNPFGISPQNPNLNTPQLFPPMPLTPPVQIPTPPVVPPPSAPPPPANPNSRNLNMKRQRKYGSPQHNKYRKISARTIDASPKVSIFDSTVFSNPLDAWDVNTSDKAKSRPVPSTVTRLHIYDFDNTLFKSPLPNPNLFYGSTIALLQSSTGLNHGGWWSNPKFLESAGEGYNIEQKRAWRGWWNEDVVTLAEMSCKDSDTISILMSGRKYSKFHKCIPEMIEAKGLEFDAIILRRGDAENTLMFKTQVIEDVLNHYENITEITIYDDRSSQIKGFQQFLKEYTEAVRNELEYHVINVFEETKYLDPIIEKKLVEEIVADHNEAVSKNQVHPSVTTGKVSLKRSLFYTAYLIDEKSVIEILKYAKTFGLHKLRHMKYHGDNIMISRGLISKTLQQKIGSEGKVVEWETTHYGTNTGRVWAIKVKPISETEKNIKTECNTPMIILATKKTSGPRIELANKITQWFPLKKQIKIRTKIGTKELFKIAPVNERLKAKIRK